MSVGTVETLQGGADDDSYTKAGIYEIEESLRDAAEGAEPKVDAPNPVELKWGRALTIADADPGLALRGLRHHSGGRGVGEGPGPSTSNVQPGPYGYGPKQWFKLGRMAGHMALPGYMIRHNYPKRPPIW
jgi:hypothetical protein